MIKSVIFYVLEHEIKTPFISLELKKVEGQIKEKYLSLTVSDIDVEGYILDRFLGQFVLGKITKCSEESERESVSTYVYHLYFMDKMDFQNVKGKIEDDFFLMFVSSIEDGFYCADKLIFDVDSVGRVDGAEKSLIQELGYLKLLEYVNDNHSARIQNDLYTSKTIIKFIVSRLDLSLLDKFDIRVGCKDAYWSVRFDDVERNYLSICKDDELAMFQLSDVLQKPIGSPFVHLLRLKDYYRLPSNKRCALRKTIENFIEIEKKESFEKCVNSCVDYISYMNNHLERYVRNDNNKSRQKTKKMKRINKTLRKVEKLLQKLSKEGSILKELEV